MLPGHALADVYDPRLAILPEDVVLAEVGVHEPAGLPVNRRELKQFLEDPVRVIDGDVLESGARSVFVPDVLHH